MLLCDDTDSSSYIHGKEQKRTWLAEQNKVGLASLILTYDPKLEALGDQPAPSTGILAPRSLCVHQITTYGAEYGKAMENGLQKSLSASASGETNNG